MQLRVLFTVVGATASMALAATTATATATAGGRDAAARAAYTRPTVPNWKIPNPGAIAATDSQGVSRFVVLSTGGWKADGTISTATDAGNPASWVHVTGRHLLDHLPTYASDTDALWAPSGIHAPVAQRYVTFYSAPVAGHLHDAGAPPRCIFSGHTVTGYLDPSASTSLGKALFRANNHPLVCWSGSGTSAPDTIGRPATGFSLIDPTPAAVDGKLFLTYKTSHKVGSNWITTIRMVRLDPSAPDRRIIGKDHQLTSWRSPSIEENPALVKHGGKYVLFTSRGWYGSDCATSRYPYHTVYRVSGDKWTWPTGVHTLSVPSGTCGKGNGQPIGSLNGTGDRFFFNGKYQGPNDPAPAFHLYVGRLGWTGSTPKVTRLYH